MLRNWIVMGTLAGACGAPLFAQFGRDSVATRRAEITGSRGNSGKCTIEVRVDDIAEVEVRGDQGRIRTLSGQPSNWVRFECSSPLPGNPSDFRFRGIDGRGKVNLVGDPRSSRGVAVVRIEDPKGGDEGYTFDLEWKGGDSFNRGGGFGGNEDWGDDRRGNNRNNGRNNARRPARGNRNELVVTCVSDNGRRRYCNADTSGGVRVLREHANSSCELNSNWGFDRRGIWVERGCQADFQLGR